MTREEYDRKLQEIADSGWNITETSIAQTLLGTQYIKSLETQLANAPKEVFCQCGDIVSPDDNVLCYACLESLRLERDTLKSDNQSLIEQMNEMAKEHIAGVSKTISQDVVSHETADDATQDDLSVSDATQREHSNLC